MFSVPETPKTPGISSEQMADELEHCAKIRFSAAQVVAANTTPLVLVRNSDALKILIFREMVLQVYGGGTNYDQNQNFIVKYQTAGGGATVSTTLANLMNGAAAGTLATCKQLTTDITPEAGQDLVLTSSASPYSAAGDRELYVTVYYTIVDKKG